MQVNKTIDFCLRYRTEILEAIEEKRLDPGNQKQGGNGSGRCRVSDPTAMKAIRNSSEIDCVIVMYGAAINGSRESMMLRRPQSWLKVIDFAHAQFANKLQWDIIKLKYENGKSRDEILDALRIGKSTYHAMVGDVFCYAAGVAAGLGLTAYRRC